MKPYNHSLISVHKFGGKVSDYQTIHDWFDQTKAHLSDQRHRLVLHNAWGIYLCEEVFGSTLTNSDGRTISVRTVGEQHVLDDLGRIPSLYECMKDLPMYNWSGGSIRKIKLEIVD